MMLEIPAALNVMLPALRELVKTVEVQVERARTGGTLDYAAFERGLAEKTSAVERSGHQVALAALAVSARES
jgi:hypothetical protein